MRPADGAPEGSGGRRAWARRVAPWLAAAAVIAGLLWRYSPAAIASRLAAEDVIAVVPWAALTALLALGAMAAADWLLFAAALDGARMRLRDVVRGRAVAQVLLAFHYGLSTAGYGVWLARRSRSGAAAVLGAMTLQMGLDLAAVCWVALGGALLGGDVLPSGVARATLAISAAGAFSLTVVTAVGARWAPRRLREQEAVAAWRRVRPARVIVSLALRIVGLGANVVGTLLAARAFGLSVPAGALAVGLPVLYLVAALPLNVIGIGVASAAWVALFDRYAPGAEVLAFQFAFQLVSTAMLLARGLPFVPSVSRDLASGSGSGSGTGSGT